MANGFEAIRDVPRTSFNPIGNLGSADIVPDLHLRDLQLLQVLEQLYGPSLQSVLEAPGVDALGRQLRQGRAAGRNVRAARGTSDTGASVLAERSLLGAFGEGVTDVLNRSAAAEAQRRQGLMDTLRNIIEGDISRQQLATGVELGAGSAAAQADAQRLQSMINATTGLFKMAAVTAGAVAGGAGGGGAAGALQGAGTAQSLF